MLSKPTLVCMLALCGMLTSSAFSAPAVTYPLHSAEIADDAIVGLTATGQPVHVARLAAPGPQNPSRIQPLQPAEVSSFTQAGDSQLAVLVVGHTPDAATWLALVDGLKARGVPVTVTRDAGDAFQHKVVVVYPYLSALNASTQAALAAHQREGGAVIAFNGVPAWAEPLFGARSSGTTRTHANLVFDKSQGIQGPVELGCFWTTPYAVKKGTLPLARYDDNGPAVTVNPHTHAYLMGVDAGGFMGMAENARQSGFGCQGHLGIAQHYADHHEPYADRLFIWIASIYRKHQPIAVTVSPVPDNKALAMVLTHDIDTTSAVPLATTYAEWEHTAGYPSTFFVQTKYIRDWEDHAFFNQSALPALQNLVTLERDIGSHSVAHARNFGSMPAGTGTETYPGYQPFVQSRDAATGGTVLGELRVSRALLMTLLHVPITAFRPGYLEYPEIVPQALMATGYSFSSNMTASDSLSALPVHLHYSRGPQAELPVFDFPIAFSDDISPVLPQLSIAVTLASAISREKGEFVLLVHPNVVGEKLAFEQQLVAAVRPYTWFGSIDGYGRFWAARDALQLSVTPVTRTSATITLTAPQAITGLTLELPVGWQLEPGSPWVARQGAGYAVLGALQGTITLSLETINKK